MAFIEYIDQKRKHDLIVLLSTMGVCVIIVIAVIIKAFTFAQEERNKVYVLSDGIPMMAELTDQSVTIDIEAKAHINMFHQLFFSLAPDDEYIKYNIERAMYLIDESGLMQKNTLQEKGFYSNIMSASANFTIKTDSIKFDTETMKFTYYGKQRIERKSSILYRELVTEGNLEKTKRTENNPHGLTITNYRTVLNKDIELKNKSIF